METPYMPTTRQQRLLSIGFVPSSLLSIIGSWMIITHIRQEQRKTPYRSILLWLSICDIISSIGWMFQPFLSPSEGPDPWVYAIGNDATCSVLGAMSQFGFSAHWYSGLLSFYFLLTARFGMQQKTFGKAMPYLHGFILLWSLSTAIAGVALGVFNPNGTGPGCWVAGDASCTENCIPIHTLVAWIFGGIPSLLMLVSIITNNLILYCHVRGTVVRGQKWAMEQESKLSMYGKTGKSGRSSIISQTKSTWSSDASVFSNAHPSHGDELAERSDRSLVSLFATDLSIATKKKSVLRSSDKQWKLVQEVGKQSFLYVGAYLLSFGWSFAINILDSQDFEYDPSAGKVFLPLLVLQSILLPTQGIFNAAIFFRPKYLKTRRQFPSESIKWCIRRAVFGVRVKPTPTIPPNTQQPQSSNQQKPPPSSLRLNFGGELVSALGRVSSLGRAFWSEDACSLIDEEDSVNSSTKIIPGSPQPLKESELSTSTMEKMKEAECRTDSVNSSTKIIPGSPHPLKESELTTSTMEKMKDSNGLVAQA
jgi:hypothetical protein